MRVLICGDREWTDPQPIKRELEKLIVEIGYPHEDELIVIHGDCRGADRIAGKEALALGLPVWSCPAEWEKYGRAAGPIRNKLMLENQMPDRVLAFHTDLTQSKGTANMVRLARETGTPVEVFSG